MVIAWGLELNKSVDEVCYVAKTLFAEDMLGGLDYILDWSVPGIEADLVECFEQKDEGRQFGYVLFLRWRAKANKPSLYKVAIDAWEMMLAETHKNEGGTSQPWNEWATFPGGKHSPQGRQSSLDIGG